jgi:hypothetical protein
MIRATATVDGRAVGTWAAPAGRVELDLFGRPPAPARTALQRDAAAVERFLKPSGLRPGGPACGGYVAASGTPTSARPS